MFFCAGPMGGGLSSDPENARCGNVRLIPKSVSIHVLSVSSTPKLVLFLMGNGGLANRVGASDGSES